MSQLPSDTVLIYMTTITSTIAIQKKQRAVLDYCEAKNIPHAQVDMCSDLNARPKMLSMIPEQRKPDRGPVLPPQIFVGDSYCGDYEDFECAKEMELIMSFFKRAPKEGSSEAKVLDQYRAAGQMPPFYPRGFKI